jgi:hypothetical protein
MSQAGADGYPWRGRYGQKVNASSHPLRLDASVSRRTMLRLAPASTPPLALTPRVPLRVPRVRFARCWARSREPDFLTGGGLKRDLQNGSEATQNGPNGLWTRRRRLCVLGGGSGWG